MQRKTWQHMSQLLPLIRQALPHLHEAAEEAEKVKRDTSWGTAAPHPNQQGRHASSRKRCPVANALPSSWGHSSAGAALTGTCKNPLEKTALSCVPPGEKKKMFVPLFSHTKGSRWDEAVTVQQVCYEAAFPTCSHPSNLFTCNLSPERSFVSLIIVIARHRNILRLLCSQ